MTTTNDRIEQRRAKLLKQRAERKDELDLPRTMTQREVNTYLAETTALGKQIADFEAKVAAWAALPSLDADTRWHAHLKTWRDQLSDDRLAIKSPIRDPELKRKAADIEWSIKLIDKGFTIAPLGIETLEPTAIGQLMKAAGFDVAGSGLRGPNGWRGCVKEVEARIQHRLAERAKAEAKLDALLLSDDERGKQAAERATFYQTLSTFTIRGNAHGDGLVAYDLDGEPLAVDQMTPAQRTAFERFVAVATPPREMSSAT